jgi:hypothetical protein
VDYANEYGRTIERRRGTITLRPEFLPTVHTHADGATDHPALEQLIRGKDEHPLCGETSGIEKRKTDMGAEHDSKSEWMYRMVDGGWWSVDWLEVAGLCTEIRERENHVYFIGLSEGLRKEMWTLIIDTMVDGDVDESIRTCGPHLGTPLSCGVNFGAQCMAVTQCQGEHLPQPKSDVTK